MFSRLLSLSFIALLMTGCAAPRIYIPLDSSTQNQLSDVKVRSQIWQDEIVVYAQPSTVGAASGGGLIGALIDTKIAESRQGKLQDIIEPFYSSIDDFDFRQQFWPALEAALKDKTIGLKTSTPEKTPVLLSHAELNGIKSQLQANNGFMMLAATYAFNHDFKSINIVLDLDLFKAGQETSAYTNFLTYQSAAVGTGGNDSINAWGANKGQRYRQVISEGIAEIIKMLKLDLTANGAGAAAGPSLTLKNASDVVISGPALDQQQDRAIIRNLDGRLHSLPR